MTSPAEVVAWLPPLRADEDKEARGRVLVVGGSLRFSGAPLLAALGAARSGAGVVTIAVGRTLAASLAGRVPEVTFLPLDEASLGVPDASAVRDVAAACGEGRYRAVVLGPGLGHEPTTDPFVLGVAMRAPVPLVVDADGLNAFARDRGAWQGRIREGTVLTPHRREAERLAGGPLGADPVGWTRASAAAWRCVLVLKGPCTVVASAGGETFVHDRPNPALATAGSGDVLSGCIAALLAAGLEPFRAACAGVLLHGEAAALVAREVGARGALATDLAARLPRAYAALRP